jgi:hypothetical protein
MCLNPVPRFAAARSDGRHAGDRLDDVSPSAGDLVGRQLHVSISSVAPL